MRAKNELMSILSLRSNVKIFGLLLLCLQAGCTTTDTRSQAVNEALKLIESCPYWNQLAATDLTGAREIIHTLEKLNNYSSTVLRLAIVKFQESHFAINGRKTFDDWTKLFLINRYIFNVPEWENSERARTYGGFFPIPRENGKVNVMWPLAINRSGEVELIGQSVGYLGDRFLAVEEFDFFLQEHGRRPKIPPEDYVGTQHP
jgi:hypothetical protein